MEELSRKAEKRKKGITAFFKRSEEKSGSNLKSSISLPMNSLKVSDTANNNLSSEESQINIEDNQEDGSGSEAKDEVELEEDHTDQDLPGTKNQTESAAPAPAQEKLKASIAEKEKSLTSLYEARATGLSGDSAATLNSLIVKTKKDLAKDKRTLKVKEDNMIASRKQRKKKSDKWRTLEMEHPEFMATIKSKSTPGPGRPRIEENQPELLSEILKIATIGSAAGDRRREDVFRTVKTLDDLHEALTSLNFKISRSGLYLRLLPRCQRSTEGKRHVNTVNVKLIKPQNDLRKKHPDRMFAAATSKAIDGLAAHLGNEACTFLGQDDKAAVAIGKTAAKVQTPLLMNMNVRVRVADHDFPVGKKHFLCPSVMAVCLISPKTGVTYSGPTYVGIRSSKHNNSTASSHYQDLWRFVELEPETFHNSSGDFKPVLIKQVDGGPDENPRYEKNKQMASKTFQDKKLDAVIELCQAPGLSAFGRCERRMFPLSKELSGVVLPADKFGSHLLGGETIDPDLELKNFEFSGETLAELWSRLEIDGFKVNAEYISHKAEVTFSVSPEWRSRHWFESQYLTAILKCDDRNCCETFKTDVECFFPNRKLPVPIPVKFGPNGLEAIEPAPDYEKQDLKFLDIPARIISEKKLMPAVMVEKYGNNVPYDAFFPSLQDKISKRICPVCRKYFSAIQSLNIHKKHCKADRKRKMGSGNKGKAKKSRVLFSEDEEDDDEEPPVESEEEEIELCDQRGKISVTTSSYVERILDLKEWMKSPWVPSTETMEA